MGFTGLPPEQGADRWPHVKRIRFQGVPVVVERLVLQVLPDRQVRDDLDPELREVSRRANARPQQNRRTSVCAPGEDYLTSGDLGAARRENADRPTLAQQHAIDEYIA